MVAPVVLLDSKEDMANSSDRMRQKHSLRATVDHHETRNSKTDAIVYRDGNRHDTRQQRSNCGQTLIELRLRTPEADRGGGDAGFSHSSTNQANRSHRSRRNVRTRPSQSDRFNGRASLPLIQAPKHRDESNVQKRDRRRRRLDRVETRQRHILEPLSLGGIGYATSKLTSTARRSTNGGASDARFRRHRALAPLEGHASPGQNDIEDDGTAADADEDDGDEDPIVFERRRTTPSIQILDNHHKSQPFKPKQDKTTVYPLSDPHADMVSAPLMDMDVPPNSSKLLIRYPRSRSPSIPRSDTDIESDDSHLTKWPERYIRQRYRPKRLLRQRQPFASPVESDSHRDSDSAPGEGGNAAADEMRRRLQSTSLPSFSTHTIRLQEIVEDGAAESAAESAAEEEMNARTSSAPSSPTLLRRRHMLVPDTRRPVAPGFPGVIAVPANRLSYRSATLPSRMTGSMLRHTSLSMPGSRLRHETSPIKMNSPDDQDEIQVPPNFNWRMYAKLQSLSTSSLPTLPDADELEEISSDSDS